MSNTTTTPTRSTEPTAPDYAVPDPQEAWEKFDRLVGKVLETDTKPSVSTNNADKQAKSFCKTVGGPIEIAVITKHEDFKWVKRKHFYRRELQPI